MSDVWALIDARGEAGGRVAPDVRVGGVPLVARNVRLAARQRWSGAVIVADATHRPSVERALTIAPPPAGFQVAVADAPPKDGRAFVPMDARSVYLGDALAAAAASGAPPVPLAAVGDRSTVRAVERRMFRALRKGLDADGVVSFYFMRPISRLITRCLLDTPVTPNMVTLAAMACGLAAAVVAGFGGYAAGAAAAGLFWFGAAVDCVDGELARMRVQGSKLGEWLDEIADVLATFGLLAGLGVGLLHEGRGDVWLLVGPAGAALGLVTHAYLYYDLHRLGLPIDTAQYPWFFGRPSSGTVGARSGPLAPVFRAVAFAFRRDAFVTILAILLVLDQRPAAAIIMCGGGALIAVLLLVHLVVGRRR